MSAPRHRRQAVREVAAWLRGLNPESREHAASDPGAVEVALAEKLVDEAEQNPGWQNGWLRVECPARYSYDGKPHTTDVEAAP